MGFFCLKNDTLTFLVHPIPAFSYYLSLSCLDTVIYINALVLIFIFIRYLLIYF